MEYCHHMPWLLPGQGSQTLPLFHVVPLQALWHPHGHCVVLRHVNNQCVAQWVWFKRRRREERTLGKKREWINFKNDKLVHRHFDEKLVLWSQLPNRQSFLMAFQSSLAMLATTLDFTDHTNDRTNMSPFLHILGKKYFSNF